MLIERRPIVVLSWRKGETESKCHGSVVSNMLEITMGKDSRRLKTEIWCSCLVEHSDTLFVMFLAAKSTVDHILVEHLFIRVRDKILARGTPIASPATFFFAHPASGDR